MESVGSFLRHCGVERALITVIESRTLMKKPVLGFVELPGAGKGSVLVNIFIITFTKTTF